MSLDLGVLRRLMLLWIAGILAAAVPARADSEFLIKPYLFSVRGEKIGLAWRNSESESATQAAPEVLLFKGGRLVTKVAADVEGDLNSVELPIPACGFGKDVSYQVPGLRAPVALEEVPCGDEESTVQFSFLADAQTDAGLAREAANELARFPSQAILVGGDLVDAGENDSMWVDFFGAMEPVCGNRVLFPTVGNHEYRRDSQVPNWKHFFRFEAKDSHYSFDLGPAHIIALNSAFEDDRSQIQGQLEWLRNELAVPAKWKIIFFHHPPYSVGLATNVLAPRKEHLYLQDYYVPLFEQYHVDLVLNGHVHLFETSEKAGVHYITVGPAGGRMGLYGGTNNFVLKHAKERTIVDLQAGPHSLRAMSVGKDGRALDDLILQK